MALRAFEGFQDLLEVTVDADVPLINRHYCYFEAVIHLREICHCLLQGNILAALVLLRPFLELATLHIYWRSKDDGYVAYYKWLNEGVSKPPFKNYVEQIFRTLETKQAAGIARTEALQAQLKQLYRHLSSYSHVAPMKESIVTLSMGTRLATVESTAIALSHTNLVLREILYLFGLSYPMILFPVDIVKKFGFGGPIGLFSHREIAALYRAAIGDKNVDGLANRLRDHPLVKERISWYESLSDMTPEQIDQTWKDLEVSLSITQPLTDSSVRHALARAHFRSFAWAMNYMGAPHPFEGMDDPKLDRLAPQVFDW